MQNKSIHPGKKAQKALQPIKKKASHRKKAQKSTMVLLKALATIPALVFSIHFIKHQWLLKHQVPGTYHYHG